MGLEDQIDLQFSLHVKPELLKLLSVLDHCVLMDRLSFVHLQIEESLGHFEVHSTALLIIQLL